MKHHLAVFTCNLVLGLVSCLNCNFWKEEKVLCKLIINIVVFLNILYCGTVVAVIQRYFVTNVTLVLHYCDTNVALL